MDGEFIFVLIACLMLLLVFLAQTWLFLAQTWWIWVSILILAVIGSVFLLIFVSRKPSRSPEGEAGVDQNRWRD